MGLIGRSFLAAHQIAINAISMVFMIPLGLALAMGIRVSQFAGREEWAKIRISVISGTCLAIVVMVLAAFLFMALPSWVAHLYTDDVQIVTVAIGLLVIAGVFQIFDGLQVVGAIVLRGLKDTRVPFLNTLISYWGIGLPLSVAFAFVFDWKGQGIWLGMVFSLATAAFLHQRRFWLVWRREKGTR